MRKVLLMILALLLLSACGPGQALGPTLTPEPTSTPIPTSTPTPTPTPIGSSGGYLVYSQGNPELNDGVNSDAPMDIIIYDLQKETEKNLTNNKMADITYIIPNVSPDGEQILFSKSTIEKNTWGYSGHELFIMDIDGTSVQKISKSLLYKGKQSISGLTHELFGNWAPSGDRIAFSSNREQVEKSGRSSDKYDCFIMDINTYDIERITDSKGSNERPTWSPDEKSICFMSDRYGDWDLFSINIESKEITQLTKSDYTERSPQWSPNGSFIAYHSDAEGNLDLYILDVNTLEITQLTNNPADDVFPSWSPDGKWILFSSDRDGDDDAYIINLDTKETIQMTFNQVLDWYADWKP